MANELHRDLLGGEPAAADRRGQGSTGGHQWKVLVVDDEPEVHSVTRLVLEGLELEGRPIALLAASSGAEAREILRAHSDIGAVLLDVVMEEEDAGLALVRYIREDLRNVLVRIIIRTGQPGRAPESHVILAYDINNYADKTDLTAARLVTAVITALRSYRDLVSLEEHAARLEQAHADLARSEERLATTLASVGDGVIGVDEHGRIALLNPVAAKLTGWTFREAERLPLAEVLRLREEVVHDTGEGLQRSRATLMDRCGASCRVAITRSPIRDAEGNRRGEVIAFSDITKLLEIEERLRQQQKLEALGTLASGIAHEINNPLTAIVNFGDMLERKLAGDPGADFAAQIVQAGERAAKIVRDLLSFARNESVTHPREPTSLSELVASLLTLLRTSLAKDRISLQIDIPEDLPKILCHPQQIEQVLMNLFTNARDAINERYPGSHPRKVIILRSRTFERNGATWVRTTVEDHSTGIRPDVLPRIFDPFFTTKPRYQGTGLGLAVSHGIVADHGGELSVETELGKHTRFHVDLPVAEGA